MRTLLLFTTLLLFLTPPANAQNAQAQQDGGSVSVSEESISELIETLESKEARTEFIQNLKTLAEADQKQKEDDLPAVSDALGIDEFAATLTQKYEATLEKYGMDKTLLGKIITSFVALFIAFFFLLIVHKLGGVLRKKVIEFNNNSHVTHNRFRLYSRLFRYFGYLIVTMILIYTLNSIWDLVDTNFLSDEFFGELIGQMASLAVIILIGIAFWELINYGIGKVISSVGDENSARMQTVLPILRNVLFIAFAVLFILVLLSEFGIDIMPLLAGAGVLGIAIGFGAQTMVKDFLTGFIIILEDLIQVGDVASLGGKTGFIERITIRKVQMRALDGTVMTVPFGEIKIVENLTKDFSYYLMDVGVAYRENTDEVIEYLREIDEEMRNDDNFKDLILDPIEVLGVDQFADSAVVIKARIKTKPIRQWDVGREFNRRMKFKFDEHNVEIPFPHQTVYFGEDKKGLAPSAPIRLENEQFNKEEQQEEPDKEKSASKNSPHDTNVDKDSGGADQ